MIRGERGSGTVVAVALLAAVILVGTAVIVAAQAAVVARRAAAAADAAALAAADTALGIVPGVPCETARRVAQADGAALTGCHLSGTTARVEVRSSTPFGHIGARARAGPPGSG